MGRPLKGVCVCVVCLLACVRACVRACVCVCVCVCVKGIHKEEKVLKCYCER